MRSNKKQTYVSHPEKPVTTQQYETRLPRAVYNYSPEKSISDDEVKPRLIGDQRLVVKPVSKNDILGISELMSLRVQERGLVRSEALKYVMTTEAMNRGFYRIWEMKEVLQE